MLRIGNDVLTSWRAPAALLRLAVLLVFTFAQGAAYAQEKRGETIRIGISLGIAPERPEAWEDWRLYLERHLRRPVVLVRRDSYRDMIELVKYRAVDFAWLSDYPYAYLARRNRVRLLGIPLYRGRPYYASYVIVGAEADGLRSIADLEGKVFAHVDPYSHSGHLVPRLLVRQAGGDPAHFFRRKFFTYSHADVVSAVAAGLADGGALASYVWDKLAAGQPDLTARARILWKSPEYAFPPVVAHASVDAAEFGALQRALLGMERDAEGRKVLAQLGLDGFVAGRPEMYAEVLKMMRSAGDI